MDFKFVGRTPRGSKSLYPQMVVSCLDGHVVTTVPAPYGIAMLEWHHMLNALAIHRAGSKPGAAVRDMRPSIVPRRQFMGDAFVAVDASVARFHCFLHFLRGAS